MQYKKFGSVYAVRIDKGEEILAKLKEFAEKENIAFARVSAIGAVGSFTAGVFDTKTKQYRANEFEGKFRNRFAFGNGRSDERRLLCTPAYECGQ